MAKRNGSEGFLKGLKQAERLTPIQLKKSKFIRVKGIGVIGVKVGKKKIKFSDVRTMSNFSAGRVKGFIRGVQAKKRKKGVR